MGLWCVISQAVECLIHFDLTWSHVCQRDGVVPFEVALQDGVQPWRLLESMVHPVSFLRGRSLAKVTGLTTASDVSFLSFFPGRGTLLSMLNSSAVSLASLFSLASQCLEEQ